MALTKEQKKQLVTIIYEEGWMNQIYVNFENYLSSQIIFHFRGSTNRVDISDLKGLISYWRSVFPDLHYDLHHVICENDIVAANMTISGTQNSEWQGIETQGNRFEVEEMMFFRFEDDIIVEIWEVYDEKEMDKQLKGE